MRRTVFVPFAIVFVLGIAMVGLGAAFALGELAWGRDGRIGQAIVVTKYMRSVETREAGRISPDHVLETRITFDLDLGSRRARGDTEYPVYRGWEALQVGDRIELEYLPSGEARLPQDGTARGWLNLVWYGLPLVVVGGAVAYGLVALEFRAGRLTRETLAAAFDTKV